MNYYLKKRLQSKLTKSDVANALGLDYIKYSVIERGDVKMPSNLINKFNEIINRGKENEIVKTENEIKADEFWQKVCQLTENGTYELQNKMKEFNINSLQQLANLLGYRSVGTIYNYLEGRNPVGVEFKKRLYNFFDNELNIQIPTKIIGSPKSKIKRTKEKAVDVALDKYYKETNFKEILRQNQITNVQIAKAIGVHNSTVSNMTCKKFKPSYKIIQEVKDYLEEVIAKEKSNNLEKTSTNKSSRSNQYISKQRLIDECEKEIENNNNEIEKLNKQIAKLQEKNSTATKFIALIQALE